MVVEPSHTPTAPSSVPPPAPGERPTEYADRVGQYYAASQSGAHRKQHGLYLTPVAAADFMAAQIRVPGDRLRLLDPAAGAGILCCAAVEALAHRDPSTNRIELVAYEVDVGLAGPLKAVLGYLREWCMEVHEIRLAARVESRDFVMAHAHALRRHDSLIPYESDDRDFDISISNPPYFKINKSDPRAVTWPLHRHKPEYIKRHGAEALLLPNRNYVLMRRFTAKEEARRLSAAPYLAHSMSVPRVGLENHLNYIYRRAGSLCDEEAWGLAALYNSRLLDTYFRCLNGNTQVNATELRAMPLPTLDFIVALGERVRQLADSLANLDPLIVEMLSAGIPRRLAVGQR